MIGFIHNWLRRRAVDKIKISDIQWHDAEYALPFLDRLSESERASLRELARELIATKEWTGARGMTLTAPMQISIALQACLPILHLGLDWYDGWIGIVVYPGDFIIPRQTMDEAGVMHEYDDEVLGEAWEGGPVLVSWFDDMNEVGDVNIVIHEFAHKLDMSNGEVDGMPALHAGMSRAEWVAAFEPAYTDFCRRVKVAEVRGEETIIDPYAATHPAEFFAVTSEVFFEAPDLLQDEYPAVYAQLARFYRQDPGSYCDSSTSRPAAA